MGGRMLTGVSDGRVATASRDGTRQSTGSPSASLKTPGPQDPDSCCPDSVPCPPLPQATR